MWFKAFAGRSAHSVTMKIAPWAMLLAVAATPTPAPVALQYDEISRIVVAPATPPAPGAFADDYKLAMSTRPTQSSQASSIDTPTLKTYMKTGSLAESIPGEPGGANTGDLGSNEAPPPQSATPVQAVRVVRYTFYFTKGWIREDDPIAQTAIISKCDEHVRITLNLAKKTYVQTNADAKGGADCFQMPGMQSSARPGTEDLTIDATSQDLGAQTIDGIATSGSSANMTMAATNATGSCRNGQLALTRVAYISTIPKPRAYCPLASAPTVATDPAQLAVQGGCNPTLHGSGASGSAASTMLEMYLLMNMTMRGRSVGMLTERGHVTVLEASDADPLFEVPAGFTPAR